MMTLPLLTALIAGIAHALEADHMAAVTTFVSRRPHPVRALGFGVRWGLGHSLALLTAGGAVVLLGLELPDTGVRAAELLVGGMLVGLGAWTIRAGSAAPAPSSPGPEPHARHYAAAPGLDRGTTVVGAAHGLAGTAGFLAILPLTLSASPGASVAYLLLFGVGTIVAMGLYGWGAGFLFHRFDSRVPTLGRMLRIATGVASAGIGALWMASALS